jgi:dihydrodipicolinate synthase/N-acetylneuraminate lyase
MLTAESRTALIACLFPGGIPRLWCPTLTHYHDDGSIDFGRMRLHLQRLAPHVKGLLVPGSTGDGWEMTEAERVAALDFALDKAVEHDLHILVGVLKTDIDAMHEGIRQSLDALRQRSGKDDDLDAMITSHVRGFTVCAPKGDLTQQQISDALASLLDLGVPMALYQLPQVTGNEIAPQTLAGLAQRYANFILFKDSSGEDRVAKSGALGGGVFLLRGAEGDYGSSLKASGGPYDGLLLSTANTFPAQLAEIARDPGAHELSDRLSVVVSEVFAAVASLEAGNAFTNANKAMDHFMAHGPRAMSASAPMLHAGRRLPDTVLAEVGRLLAESGMMSEHGYLSG